jgi:hypothetical protein
MDWREAFSIHLGPGAFAGMTLGRWFRVLRENHFAVDWRHWGRAGLITLGSVPNSVLSWWETLVFNRRVRRAKVAPPLFILGVWRSGTTHLHNLLAQDDRFAFPNFYQVMYPATFLCTEWAQARFVGFFLPRKRPQDNVLMGVREPQEDEFAICSLTGHSFILSLAFPRQAELYDRYLTLRSVPDVDRAEWKAALTAFVQKLSFKDGRPLLLKSPGHTARIKLLLELFPEARFVHIRRNPYDVFQSTRHTVLKAAPWWALQRKQPSDVEDRTIRQYREVYDAFFEERGLIQPARIHELRFEDLEADAVGQARAIYQALNLPDFSHVEPALRAYVDSLGGYKKNTFPELPGDLRARLGREWRRCFEEWNYPA